MLSVVAAAQGGAPKLQNLLLRYHFQRCDWLCFLPVSVRMTFSDISFKECSQQDAMYFRFVSELSLCSPQQVSQHLLTFVYDT
jgi:hypothetical protein